MQENNIHQVTIEQKKSIAVSGVESVLSFSESKITLSLLGGGKLHVAGSGLKISGFSKQNGVFSAEGAIAGVSYGGKSFAAKIFR
ncbi:MAG: YabP/YqfC family sporulation protein [Clostridia bacterium]|nr:YabP/YqfC family sporulation protein [Clostridia bacterium]